ncbi:related to Vacuolar amino acid transporter 2 [Saccharomycodes ludwigii]|uniref:Related to Vacuolar amino acid transporter 2 n=1 Tax=Saccharomycodes ludwigii TaxID=36035 RepID=A0A376B621_9ASCO|nr:hypothetical protein SCDLUD_003891 [Saccharomycodes ludwigii]KAH3899611.1 hypothetical protein SCDLUD_003891 [Saccharomycodes ludwigii]SSD60082.1 related to Vacuolar amino acid transporter 2 [Saccharomycodes ludwigii]
MLQDKSYKLTNENSFELEPADNNFTGIGGSADFEELEERDINPPSALLPNKSSPDVENDEETIDNDNFIQNITNENLRKSTLFMAFMNMTNSILGAGVIGLPLAIRNTGLIGGVLAIIMLTLLVDWTLRLIVINLKLSSKTTYQDFVEYTLGKWGKFLILISNGLFAVGGCIGFCIIIGDTIPHVLRAFFPDHSEWFHRNIIIVLVTVFISYPLSLNRDISKLSNTSFLAIISMLVIIFMVLLRGPVTADSYKGSFSNSSIFILPSFFQGVSVISFALVCHHNTSFIYFSIRNPSLKRFNRMTHISCFVSMIALFIMGFSGFGIFKDKTKGNILNNFPSNDNYINVARFCFGFNMLTTFPLEVFVLRDVIRDLLYFNVHSDTPVELSSMLHFTVTTIIVLITMGISLTTCNLGALLELVGATTASLMAYILPPYCNLKLIGNNKTLWEKKRHYFCIFFGFAVLIISTTQTIISAIKSSEEKHCIV